MLARAKLKIPSLKNDPSSCQRSETQTQTPSTLLLSISERKSARTHARGAGGGTGPPSRCCALGHTGPPPCVKDDTLQHRPWKTGEEKSTRPLHDSTNPGACVICGPRCVVAMQSWQMRPTHAKADLLKGEGREPRGRKAALTFPIRSLGGILSRESRGTVHSTRGSAESLNSL